MRSAIMSTSDRPRPVATPEHEGWMVVSAAEVLAAEHPDPSARLRFKAIVRRLLAVLRSSRIDDRSIREASPVITGLDGSKRPIIELLAGYGGDPQSGVEAAMTILLVVDWQPAAQEVRRDRPLSSRSRRPNLIPADGQSGKESVIDGVSP